MGLQAIPPQLYWVPAVQIVLIVLIGILSIWTAKAVIRIDKKVVQLETIITNHFLHRFQKLKEKVGMEWDDDLDEENERDNITS